MHTPRSKTSSHNSAYSGNIDATPRPKWDEHGYISLASPEPWPRTFADDNGQLEVILDCFKHYTRINQDDIGNPDADLTCLKCIKGNGVW